MNYKTIVVLLCLLITSVAFSNEKITDFKFKLFGPLEKRVYLKDADKQTNYGYYSVRPLISYSKDNYLLSALAFRTSSVENKLIASFKEERTKTIDHKDILNLTNLYYSYKTNMILSLVAGPLGLAGTVAGAVFVALSATFFEEAGYTFDMEGEYVYDNFLYGFLRYPGIALLSTCGLLFILTLTVFMPMCLYHYSRYKTLKGELLNIINGIPVSYNDKKLFKLKFDLRFTS